MFYDRNNLLNVCYIHIYCDITSDKSPIKDNKIYYKIINKVSN